MGVHHSISKCQACANWTRRTAKRGACELTFVEQENRIGHLITFEADGCPRFEPRQPIALPEFYTVTLSRDGAVYAKVDFECVEEVRRFNWSLHECGKGKTYARCQRHGGEVVRIYMHRLIAKAFLPPPRKPNFVVDHINGDGLDNRLSNLRWLDPYENRRRYARHAT